MLADLRADPRWDVRALMTTITEGEDRISMHGVRRELLERQAKATGLPLVEVPIPPHCVNEVYEQRIAGAFAGASLRGIDHVAYGDLFLEDIRAYREERLLRGGKRGVFPLWRRDTADLARRFVNQGFRAALICVDPAQLDPSFCGRELDAELLDDLPPGVDPCGENGEFHTFVYDGPIFSEPIQIERRDISERDGFVYQDLVAA